MGINQSKKQNTTQKWESQQIHELHHIPGYPMLVRQKQVGCFGELYNLQANDDQDGLCRIYDKRKEYHKNIVNILHYEIQQNCFPCGHNKQNLTVISEHISYRLTDFTDLSFNQGIYIFYQSLVGFQEIYKYGKLCYPTKSMIGITQKSEIKVWVNEIWAKNYCREIRNQAAMIQQLWMVVRQNIIFNQALGFDHILQSVKHKTFQAIHKFLLNNYSRNLHDGRFLLQQRVNQKFNQPNNISSQNFIANNRTRAYSEGGKRVIPNQIKQKTMYNFRNPGSMNPSVHTNPHNNYKPHSTASMHSGGTTPQEKKNIKVHFVQLSYTPTPNKEKAVIFMKQQKYMSSEKNNLKGDSTALNTNSHTNTQNRYHSHIRENNNNLFEYIRNSPNNSLARNLKMEFQNNSNELSNHKPISVISRDQIQFTYSSNQNMKQVHNYRAVNKISTQSPVQFHSNQKFAGFIPERKKNPINFSYSNARASAKYQTVQNRIQQITQQPYIEPFKLQGSSDQFKKIDKLRNQHLGKFPVQKIVRQTQYRTQRTTQNGQELPNIEQIDHFEGQDLVVNSSPLPKRDNQSQQNDQTSDSKQAAEQFKYYLRSIKSQQIIQNFLLNPQNKQLQGDSRCIIERWEEEQSFSHS